MEQQAAQPIREQGRKPGADEARQKRNTRIMLGVIGLVLVVFVILPGVLMATTPHPHGTRYDDPPAIADFELPRADGGMLRFSELRGQAVVVYFGFTSCPDVCPATLYDLRLTMEALGDEAEQVQVLFITIDPENDTPERISEYLGYFDPSFIGLYGTEEQLEAVRDQFGVRVLRGAEGQTIPGYTLTHTTSMFVVDPNGYLKLRMHHETDVRFLIRDLQYVIRGRL